METTGTLENKIVTTDLNLHYGTNHALKDINLDIYTNKITAFIGPSGCGKSTYLKTLNRMNDRSGFNMMPSIWQSAFTVPPKDTLVPNAMWTVPYTFSSSRMIPQRTAFSFVPIPSSPSVAFLSFASRTDSSSLLFPRIDRQ